MVGTVAEPDRNTTGSCRGFCRRASCTSSPFMPSMHRSSTAQAGPDGRSWPRKSAGDANVFTSSPADRINRETLRRTAASSSTTGSATAAAHLAASC